MQLCKYIVVYPCLALSSIACSSITSVSSYSDNEITVGQDKKNNVLIGIKKRERDLTDYVRSLTHELVSNMNYVKPQSVLASSSFVYVDGDFLTMPTFAKQIQESFTYEFHKIGQPIIEFKSTGFIRVLPEGDFALSTDYTELKTIQPIDYILMGTLTALRDGVQVNAKVVGAKSHAVVAVAQIIIPREVIDNVIPTIKKGQSIKLIKQ
ncbi:MAG: FlgO family outer membrane protein [Colwellia sp.]